MNTPRLFSRPQTEARGLNSELLLRYGAAALVTLIALAAAQLVLPTKFMLALGAVTIVGVPVSLWMRLHDMRIGGVAVPRPLWNALTVTASGAASLFFLRVPLRNITAAIESGLNDAALTKMGATDPMLLLVQLFLVFAAFRSFSIISDKDATLATVPSFSVLLLLIPVYRQLEVVCYFLVWTVVATLLFALDHRSEIHAQVTAAVPAPAPGQEVKLAARSLAGVLGFSLVVAIALSGLLTARDPREGAASDSAISLLASRMVQFTLQNQSGSVNNGPERQIDFSSDAALPTRAKLWTVTRTTTRNGELINPPYWRLFTLSDYNGSVWSQNGNAGSAVERTALDRNSWPRFRDGNSGGGRIRGGRIDGQRRQLGGNGNQALVGPQAQSSRSEVRRAPNIAGFDVGAALPALAKGFGTPTETVTYQFTAARAALGFIPLLPTPTRIVLVNSEQTNLRVRRDGGIDVSLAQANQSFRATSQVPKLPEYGFADTKPPLERDANRANANRANANRANANRANANRANANRANANRANANRASANANGASANANGASANADRANANGVSDVAGVRSPQLSADERASNLRLPANLPARVRRFSRDATRDAGANSSNYARALLLARATQKGAIYTLRPPMIPTDRDAADFFLFESRRGYCTYFAGALTVLCRAQNIPARVVSGFVAPETTNQGEVIIRDANAHAWTEVWVENWGWAPVDATPADDRGDNAPTLLENWSDLAASRLDVAFRWSLVHWAPLLGGASLFTLAFAGWRFRRELARLTGRESAPDVAVLRRQIVADYARASRQLARRFRPRQAWETPDEWLSAAREQLTQLPLEPLQKLTALYVRARFSPHEISSEQARQARAARESLVWKEAR